MRRRQLNLSTPPSLMRAASPLQGCLLCRVSLLRQTRLPSRVHRYSPRLAQTSGTHTPPRGRAPEQTLRLTASWCAPGRAASEGRAAPPRHSP